MVMAAFALNAGLDGCRTRLWKTSQEHTEGIWQVWATAKEATAFIDDLCQENEEHTHRHLVYLLKATAECLEPILTSPVAHAIKVKLVLTPETSKITSTYIPTLIVQQLNKLLIRKLGVYQLRRFKLIRQHRHSS